MAKSSTGLDENTAGVLCYLLVWVSGLVFILIEQESSLVKFHAMQSLIVFGALSVLSAVLSWIPILGWFLNAAIGILAVILWILLMIKASRGERYKVKWAGDYAEKWSA